MKEIKVEYNSNTNIDTSNDVDKISNTNLKTIHVKNLNQIAVINLNMNSLKNKLEVDILRSHYTYIIFAKIRL